MNTTALQIFKGPASEQWDNVEAAQDAPFLYIQGNGSKWAGEQPDDLDSLLHRLQTDVLDPRLEPYGNFIDPCPCKGVVNPHWTWGSTEPHYTDGPPLFRVPVTHFSGNFLTYSHVFSIYTNDPATIETLTTAIRANQQTPAYLAARKER